MREIFLKREAVERATGLSRSTIYDEMSRGRFPLPVKVNGGRAVAWLESEIVAWQAKRIAERDAAFPRKPGFCSDT